MMINRSIYGYVAAGCLAALLTDDGMDSVIASLAGACLVLWVESLVKGRNG